VHKAEPLENTQFGGSGPGLLDAEPADVHADPADTAEVGQLHFGERVVNAVMLLANDKITWKVHFCCSSRRLGWWRNRREPAC
jgi:hypothetical protein